MDEMKPLWVRGVRRSLVDYPDEIKEIMDYLRRTGDLRVNAKKVELLWIRFSKRSGENFRAVTETSLESFVTYLESGIDENDYFTVQEQYEAWEKTPDKIKEVPMSSGS